MPEQPLADDLLLAHRLADAADSITLARFRAADLVVNSKPDLTPVSDADTAVEDAIRGLLAIARPTDAVHGEERRDTGSGPRRWVVDPIDGTANFVRGVPVWATLVALLIEDEVMLGLVSAPVLGRRWWAIRGGGAFAGSTLADGKPCRVSAVAAIADASLSLADLGTWAEVGRGQRFNALLRDCWRVRAFGEFWSYMLLAEGALDLAAESALALHDMAAPSIIVAEAGGRFTSLDGVPGPYGPGAVASNGLLHDELLARLRPDIDGPTP